MRVGICFVAALLVLGCHRDVEDVESVKSAYSIAKSALIAVNATDVWVETSTTTAPYLSQPLKASSETFSGEVTTLVADVNGDSWSDVIAVNNGSIRVKTATPSLTKPQFAASGQWLGQGFSGTTTLAADVDGDGKADLIAWNNGTIDVRKAAAGTFEALVRWSTETFSGARNLSGDFNGDGKADLVAWDNAAIRVKFSDGATFGSSTPLSSEAFFGTVNNVTGDVNGDGKADLVAWDNAAVRVKLSTGSGFAAAKPWSSVSFSGGKANLIGDINLDGKADLIALNDTSTYVMLSNGAGFESPQLLSTTAFYGGKGSFVGGLAQKYSVLKSDLIAVKGDEVWVEPNTSSAPYVGPPVRASTQAFYGSVATLAGDITGDGWSDLIAVNETSVWVKTAITSSVAPQFSAATLWSTEGLPTALATIAGDVDGDGKADLISWKDNSVSVKLSTGSAFGAATPWSTELFYGIRAHPNPDPNFHDNPNVAGDINGDGKLDLIAWNDNSVWVKISNGAGFGTATRWSNESFVGDQSNLVGDVDGDGWADLIAWNFSSRYVKKSNGASEFGVPTPWSGGNFAGSKDHLIGDLNQDGMADLIALSDTSIWVQYSTQTSFTEPQRVSTNSVPGTVGNYVGTSITSSAGWAPVPPLDTSTSVQPSMTASTPPAATVARYNSGALELIALNTSGSPIRATVGANPSWSTMGNLSGAGAMLPLVSPPVIAVNADGRLEAFAHGADSAIWKVAQSSVGTWGTWQSFGFASASVPFASAPAVVRNSSGIHTLFAITLNGAAFARAQAGANGSSWSAWTALPSGVVLRSDPQAVLDSNGDINLFARGQDEGIWTIKQQGGQWGTWKALGGIIKGRFAISLNGNNGLELVGIDQTNNLARNVQPSPSGSWSGWSSLRNNKLASGLSMLKRATGELEVFAVGGDKKIWRIAQTHLPDGSFSWGSWASLTQTATSAPAVGQATDGSLQLFARASSLQLSRSSLPSGSSTWSSWNEISGAVRLATQDPLSAASQAVLTQHNDVGRTGATLVETKLNAYNVSPHQFGLLFRRRVDGDVTAQPLFVPQLSVKDNVGVDLGVHDVVIVATAHNTVYAFDANDPQAVAPLWTKHFGDSIAMPNPDFGNKSDHWEDNNHSEICDLYKAAHPNGTPTDAQRRVTQNHSGYNLREIGITSTPVVDPTTNTLYVVSFEVDPAPTNPPLDCLNFTNCNIGAGCTGQGYRYMLHALDLTTHAEKLGAPVALSAQVAAASRGSDSQGILRFEPTLHMQRPALLLTTNDIGIKAVYIAFGGFGDVSDWHGWVLAYDATTLGRRGAYVTTPTSGTRGAGIWQSGQGPVADSSGNVYFETGNGFGGNGYQGNLGYVDGLQGSLSNAVIKLSLASTLAAQDYFEPAQGPGVMNGSDIDLGSAGPMLIPGTNWLAATGKIGMMYLLNRGALGHYLQGAGGTDQVVQEFWATSKPNQSSCTYAHVHGSPVYWRGAEGAHLYVWGEEDYLRSFAIGTGTSPVATSGSKDCSPFAFPVGQTDSISGPTSNTPDDGSMPGGILSVSGRSSVSGTGIVWATRPLSGTALWHVPTGLLEAYDASDLSIKLWDSGITAEDSVGMLARFTPPTVANGKVYVATFASRLDAQDVPYAELVVYGAK